MLAHGGIMAVSFFIPLISYPAGKVIIGTLIVLISHLIIDAFIVEIKKLLKVDPPKYLFHVFLGIDQMLHISILYFVFSRIVL